LNRCVHYAVHSGYAEVSFSAVTVLVESAERADQIDRERAARAKERATEKLAKLSKEDSEFERARLALIRALTRLNVATKG
jgi:F-type H+-transporting ATPase subunit epsilon